VVTSRDRDQAGRPRNTRPRDELGRPLPRTAPAAGSATPVPATLTPGESAGIGASLLLDGYPFHAHEVFEDAWKAATGPERDLWRGLAQVAVGLTHARRDNARGAVALLTRGASLLRDYAGKAAIPPGDAPGQAEHSQPSLAGHGHYGIDVAFVAARAAELAAWIERDGLSALPPQALLLGLSPGGCKPSPQPPGTGAL
jgi:hypothetical protein